MEGMSIRASFDKSKTLTGLFLLAFFTSADASTDVTFWESPVNSKLNSIEVDEIVQDGSGAIWFATQEGLTRQRGEDVDIFTAANAAEGGLRQGKVRSLAVSKVGHLWVLTRNLQVFNPESESFEVPKELDYEIESNAIAFDAENRLWIGLEDSVGLYRPGLGQHQIIDLPENYILEQGKRLRARPIIKLIPYGEGMLGINSEAVFEFKVSNKGTVEITERAKLTNDELVIANSGAIYNGTIYIGTISNGLITVDLNTNFVSRITEGPNYNDLPTNLITAALSDERGVWLGTQNGLVFTEDGGRSFQYYGETFTGLPSNWIVGLFKSSDGSYWVGTRAGLAQGARTQFNAFNPTNSNLSHNHVNAVHQMENGSIWVGTQDGLNELKPGENNFRWINSNSEKELESDQIMSLASQDEVLWIGTFDSGLYRLDTKSNEVTRVAMESNNPFALQAAGITAILPHASGDLVVSTFGGGTAIVDSSGRVKRILRSPPGEYLNDYPITLAQDANGTVFVGMTPKREAKC